MTEYTRECKLWPVGLKVTHMCIFFYSAFFSFLISSQHSKLSNYCKKQQKKLPTHYLNKAKLLITKIIKGMPCIYGVVRHQLSGFCQHQFFLPLLHGYYRPDPGTCIASRRWNQNLELYVPCLWQVSLSGSDLQVLPYWRVMIKMSL